MVDKEMKLLSDAKIAIGVFKAASAVKEERMVEHQKTVLLLEKADVDLKNAEMDMNKALGALENFLKGV